MSNQLQVTLIEHSGSDELVANAARVSTNRDNQGREIDGLIRYLAREGHLSPFEHNSITFMVKAPLFVRDQWVRHRTQSYNSLSMRYTKLNTDGPLSDMFYIPPRHRPLENRGSKAYPILDEEPPKKLYDEMMYHMVGALDEARYAYNDMLEAGVAEEVARMVLPESTMTRFYATANLRNWYRFVKERTAENAQWEIKELARQVNEVLEGLFPISWFALWEV